MTAYIGVLDSQWKWTGKNPEIYTSSPGVERRFCATCGSPVSFRSESMSGTMHFFVATLEEPEKVSPTLHVAIEEKLPWLDLSDELPAVVGPDYTKV